MDEVRRLEIVDDDIDSFEILDLEEKLDYSVLLSGPGGSNGWICSCDDKCQVDG
jgi:hypothetical protein